MDLDKTVRVAAARSIGRLGNDSGALLLRLRALAGDEEPEPLAACFSTLLGIEGKRAIPFVSGLLDAGNDTAREAALALGLMRDPEAFGVLKSQWEREKNALFADTLLTAIGLTRLPEAIDLLIQLVRTESLSAEPALEAPSWARADEEIRARLETAVGSTGNSQLRRLFLDRFA